MLILAFESSAKACSVALHDGNTLLAESYCNTAMTHSQTLLVMAQQLLENHGYTPGQVTAVAVAIGPGSFTGLRIGIAAAKGFAWGAELPCCGISTLEAMATGLGIPEGYVCPVMDARRQQVYNALFRAENGTLTRLCGDRAIPLEDLARELEDLEGPVYLVGDGSLLCHDVLSRRFSHLILPPEFRRHQRAAGVAVCAAGQLARGISCPAQQLIPNYLRLSQAEREKLERAAAQKETSVTL